MRGLPATGSISLGTAFVAGSILVPKPAAGITAFTIFRRLNIVRPSLKPLEGKSAGNRVIKLDVCLGWGLNGFPFHLGDSQFRVRDQEMPDQCLERFRMRSHCGRIDNRYEY